MPGQENGQRGREDDGSGRTYLGPDGERWPSMTTLTGLVPGKEKGLALWRGRVGDAAADEVMTKAVERGNALHDAIEQGGGPESVQSWLAANVASVVAQELTVANRTERYAGTADLLGFLADGRPFVLDWKSGKRRPEHAIQVVGYADADLALSPEGEWRPFGEGWSWATWRDLPAVFDPATDWYYQPGRSDSDVPFTRPVVALLVYLSPSVSPDGELTESLNVQEVRPDRFDYLRQVRRGLRDSWAWHHKPGQLTRRFKPLAKEPTP